ncbi:MAG TPA: ABC transporter ATP-binding protein [Thermodesulfobacteriota bacterium]|nr:ABC transporter ATP-binding protein [Thermodesulfobacteriota bacterium]
MSIRIVGVSKRFGNLEAVKNVSLAIGTGEFFTLLGPSGCGKTTLLRSIAGFNQQESGEIYFGEKRIDRIAAHKRGIGMVFQNYAVFPHLCVYDNIAYGLKARKLPNPEIGPRVEKAMQRVRLEGLGGRLPNQLSGGQLQRVAIARALVIEPQVLLMDEPLSNLDAKLRVEMRGEIRELQQQMRITTVYVTHDQEEALSISDRIGVMNLGVVEQVGKPWEIYNTPVNRFVAGFIGTTNFFEGRWDGKMGAVLVGDIALKAVKPPAGDGRTVHFAIRPEAFKTAEQATVEERAGMFGLNAVVKKVEYLGYVTKYDLELAPGVSARLIAHDVLPANLRREGEALEIFYDPGRALVF